MTTDNPAIPYQIGNALFRDVRALLNSVGLDEGREFKITIGVPTEEARTALVEGIRKGAPGPGEFSHPSAAWAGNFGGYWQGIEYEIAIRAPGPE